MCQTTLDGPISVCCATTRVRPDRRHYIRKPYQNMSKSMCAPPGRLMVGWYLMWCCAEWYGAVWDEHKERTQRRKWDVLQTSMHCPVSLGSRLHVRCACDHRAHNVLAPHIIRGRLAPHIPCRSKHHAVCSLHAVTPNDTCPANAMLLVTVVSQNLQN